jgi:uncharacterized membrane protein
MLYIYLVLLILCWTINPFMKKILLKKLNPYEYLMVHNIIIACVIFALVLYFTCIDTTKIKYTSYNSLSKCDVGILLLGAISTIFASLMFLYIIKLQDISYILPHIQSIIITLSLIIGYYFFYEKVNFIMLMGIALIIGGITLINVSK